MSANDVAPDPIVIGAGPLQVAILDDYPLLSPAYIDSLAAVDRDRATFTIFRDTLAPVEPTLPSLITRLRPFSVIVTMRERTPFPAALVTALPSLKYLMTTGLRNLSLDLIALSAQGVQVSGTTLPPSSGGTSATAQHTWALILALSSNIPRDTIETAAGGWLRSQPLNVLLAGKTLALLGLGKLGGEVARIGAVFGMRVLAWSENLTQEKADVIAQGHGLPGGTYEVAKNKEELFRRADVVTVHVVLGDRTRGLVGTEELGWMKGSAMLVNTSRGPIIDESALFQVLQRGSIRGAALDVYDLEPLPLDSPWRTTAWGHNGRSQVVTTPHSGYAYEETLVGMWSATMANLKRYLNGEDVEHCLI